MDSGGKNTKLGRLLTSAKEEGRRKKEEGRRKREEGRGKKEEGIKI
ncbi:hypothetical protein [Phormidium nigroviride]